MTEEVDYADDDLKLAPSVKATTLIKSSKNPLLDALEGIPYEELVRLEKLAQLKNMRVTFAKDYHVNTHDEKMDFDSFPHIWDIYNSTAKSIVIQGSTQCFKSEWVIIDHLACAYMGLSVFFVVPKIETRNTYVQNRINRCISNVPEYKKIIRNSESFDSVVLKQFGKGIIKYVGSNVYSDFKEYPADVVIIDEVDECHQENLRYAEDRLMASKYKFFRRIGNPKLHDKGINKYFLLSDQREWHIPCENCGELCEVDWFKCVVQPIQDAEGVILDYKLRDSTWSPEETRDISLMCEHCNSPLDRKSKKGKWIPKNPSSRIEGYHMSALFVANNTISGMWKEFRAAQNNPSALQHFYNSTLGIPFEAPGTKVNLTLLKKCVRENYAFEIKPDCAHIFGDEHPGPCSMGIDVGGVFDVRISYVDSSNNRVAVFIGKVSSVEELYRLIKRYNVEVAVIDADPELHLVTEFKDLAACDAWSCKFRMHDSRFANAVKSKIRIISPDRTESLDMSLTHIKRKRNVLPENFEQILSGEYVSEMCMPERIVEETPRGARFVWSKGKDHQRLCDTYDMLAWLLMQDSTIDSVVVV